MAPISPAPTQQQTSPKPSRWWELVIYAALCFGVAAYYHSEITSLETSGGSIKIPVLLLLPYQIGGKWGLVGILGAIGACSLALGVIRAFGGQSSSRGRVPVALEDPVWASRMREQAPPAPRSGPAPRKR
jgi:hypothetical protein